MKQAGSERRAANDSTNLEWTGRPHESDLRFVPIACLNNAEQAGRRKHRHSGSDTVIRAHVYGCAEFIWKNPDNARGNFLFIGKCGHLLKFLETLDASFEVGDALVVHRGDLSFLPELCVFRS